MERRHGEQPSQTPPLSGLIRRQQFRNSDDEAPTTSRGNSAPVQAPVQEDLEGDVDGLQNTPLQLPRRGRPRKRPSPPSGSPLRPRGRPRLARNPVGRPRTHNLPEENPPREFNEPGSSLPYQL
ncbi:hypothetical protein F5144DRAFT_574177 [Chaetomium tenue]|uniref:Uncharacterized protein n=1 Tax=Chaetomium tenue TaxID=1854479 RepID=A0ACB7P8C3_9PEZI|nr:hypothetical protein F5144DRAFT_574177 [Chaetomium globosum]